MPTRITEFHGAAPLSPLSQEMAAEKWCPFIDAKCKKTRSGGACSLAAVEQEPVIICPNRLYGGSFQIIRDIAIECFGGAAELVTAEQAEERRRSETLSGDEVIVYGQGFSGELGISAPSEDEGSEGTFKIDYLLTSTDSNLVPNSIVAIEVQTIDTTNSYSDASSAFYSEKSYQNAKGTDQTSAGFNWENVSKRILPQVIYKGHALRRERLAQHGLYFVLPDQVFAKIKTRVGGRLLEYPKGPGTVTFKSFVLSDEKPDCTRDVLPKETLTTTVEQIAFAFVSPQNLPDLGVYEATLTDRLAKLSRKRNL